MDDETDELGPRLPEVTAAERGVRVLSPAEVPDGIGDLSDPPARLFARGALPTRPAVAIVGTRRADRSACTFTHELARALAQAGLAIVSGGAEGIDIEAHRGALAAAGRTFVVQAAALERPFPRKHRAIFDEVLAHDGGWLSETPPGAPTHKSRFLARNRLIAALSDAVVVVQAPARSGALSTARHAIRLGRPLLVVPSAPWDPRGHGGLGLLARGATLCRDSQDVLHALGRKAPKRRAAPSAQLALPAGLSAEARRVLEQLAPQPAHVDELSVAAGLPAHRVRVVLVELAANGLAGQEGGRWRTA